MNIASIINLIGVILILYFLIRMAIDIFKSITGGNFIEGLKNALLGNGWQIIIIFVVKELLIRIV